MIEIEARLRYAPDEQCRAAASFIAGDCPDAWLDELASWGDALDSVRLYPIARSRGDLRPCGVLIVSKGPGEGVKTPSSAYPFRKFGERLYLPADARLWPAAEPRDIEQQLVGDFCVWHPAAGLASFEAADALTAADLLQKPVERQADWGRARAGSAAAPRLLSVRPVMMPTWQESLDEWRDDLGTQPADKLPPTPDEPGGVLGQLRSFKTWAGQLVARGTPGQEAPSVGSGRRSTYVAIAAGLLVAALFAAAIFAVSRMSTPAELASSLPEPAPTPIATSPPPAITPPANLPGQFDFDWPPILVALSIVALVAVGVGMARNAAGGVTAAGAAMKSAAATIKRIADRAVRRVGGLTGSLAASQRREVARLLHLLDVDPDHGLRFALPLTGGAHRGVAPPSGHLAPRETDFQLARLGGGRPADVWRADYEQHFRLQRRYRELATRELELGRHRRAAYILAELLGDLSGAASALEQGGYFHEAAVLYRDKLGKPLAAARCFERGGDFDEAVSIYLERGELETAADLLVRLERTAEATALYRHAANKARSAGDYQRAARLFEEKLHSVDEAIATLVAAWPDSAQAGTCLESLFGIFGKTGRHAEASRWVARLKTETSPGRPLNLVMSTLPRLATRYPDRTVRAESADAARVLAGNRLPCCEPDEAAQLVGAVRSLVPQDILLRRDSQRYLDRQHRQPASSRGRLRVVPFQSFRLPGAEWWQTATPTEGGFLAAGHGPAGVVAARVCWDGQAQFLHWRLPLSELGRLTIVSPPDVRQANLVAVLGQSRQLEWQTFPAIDGDPLPTRIGTPSWLDGNVLAVACSDTGIWWSIDDRLVLNAVQGGSVALSTRQLSLAELGFRPQSYDGDDPRETPALIAARGDRVAIAWGKSLAIVQGHRLTTLDLPGRARRLTATRAPLPLCLAIGFDDYGAAVVWLDRPTPTLVTLASGLPEPELAWTRDGWLIALHGRDIRVYAPRDHNIVERCRVDCRLNMPVALLPGDVVGEFSVLTASGEVNRFRIDGERKV